jgi:hypothetical protein
MKIKVVKNDRMAYLLILQTTKEIKNQKENLKSYPKLLTNHLLTLFIMIFLTNVNSLYSVKNRTS